MNENCEVIFVAHDTQAYEVDEDKFFKRGNSGGTIVSSGLERVDEIIDKSGVMAAYSFYKICPINLFDLKNEYSKVKNKRYLKYFPNIENNKTTIKKLIDLNYKMSKKNNLNRYVETYEKNFN